MVLFAEDIAAGLEAKGYRVYQWGDYAFLARKGMEIKVAYDREHDVARINIAGKVKRIDDAVERPFDDIVPNFRGYPVSTRLDRILCRNISRIQP